MGKKTYTLKSWKKYRKLGRIFIKTSGNFDQCFKIINEKFYHVKVVNLLENTWNMIHWRKQLEFETINFR